MAIKWKKLKKENKQAELIEEKNATQYVSPCLIRKINPLDMFNVVTSISFDAYYNFAMDMSQVNSLSLESTILLFF
jgi:hypothetical protein